MLGIHVIGLIVCFFTVYMIGRSNTREKANYMVVTIACNIISLVGYILELMATTEEAMITSVKVQYLGKCFIGTFLLFTFVRYYKWKFPKFLIRGFHRSSPLLIIIRIYYNSLKMLLQPFSVVFDGKCVKFAFLKS